MSAETEPERFSFAGFSLDRGQRLLFGADGKAVPLSARAFDTLSYLVQHPNQLIEKQTLMKAVWPNVIVEENNLNQNISLVRRALGETPGDHRFVVTVPGRGFWFVSPVTRGDAISKLASPGIDPPGTARGLESTNAAELLALAEATPVPPPVQVSANVLPAAETPAHAKPPERANTPARWIGIAVTAVVLVTTSYLLVHYVRVRPVAVTAAPLPTPASVPAPEPSIAVLPFVNISADENQEYFSDGLTEELSTQLGQLHGLRVVGRTSAFAFKGKNEDLRRIGATLGVDHLLEGSVRKVGNEVRITAELVDAKSGTRLWSDVYERKLDDIFSIQEEIAKAVATQLRVTLRTGLDDPGMAGTHNTAAYDAYLAAQADLKHVASSQYLRGIEELEHAVALDPKFVRAWSDLAAAYDGAVGSVSASDADYLKKAEFAFSRALQLAPDSQTLLMQAGFKSLLAARDWTTLERLHKNGLAKVDSSNYDGNYYAAFWLRNSGRPHESLPYLQRAVRAEPLVLNASVQLQDAYLTIDDSKSAEAEYERSKPLGENSVYGDYERLLVKGQDRHDPALVKQFFRAHPPNSSDDPALEHLDPVLQGLDDPAGAVALLQRRYRDPAVQASSQNMALLAQFAAYYGESELALQFLHKAFKASPYPNIFFIWHGVYRDMRRLPGFKDLLRELGLVDYWRATGNWGEFCHPVGKDDFACT